MHSEHAARLASLPYRLRGLGMGGAVLHVGAHPDDEDVGLLSYLTGKFGVRAVYWSATRGEGGQNRLNAYRDEALGIYRTWESLAARAVDGGECLFGPFYDFGYSKNAEEAFAKWGREAVVREIVRAIRLVQPHVVVSRWSGTADDEHGHHQAIGQATREAFEAAGDAERVPELRALGLAAWQPSKLYQSMGGDFQPGQAGVTFGQLDPRLEQPGILKINTGEFDPVAGITYQARAWAGYNRHQTQAMGFAPAPGDFFYYYRLVKSLVAAPPIERDLFEGMDPSLTGLADYPDHGLPYLRDELERVKALASDALQRFRIDRSPEAAWPILEGLAGLRRLRSRLGGEDRGEPRRAVDVYLAGKIVAFEQVAARCLGLELECQSERGRIIPGGRFRLSARLWNHLGIPIDDARFSLSLPHGWHGIAADQRPGEERPPPGLAVTFEVTTPEATDLSCPYWLARPRGPYAYEWPEDGRSGHPLGPVPVGVACDVIVGNHRVALEAAALRREAFPGGFRELPLAVIPPISLHPVTRHEFVPIAGPRHRRPVRSEQELKSVLGFLEENLSDRRLELEVVAVNNGAGPLEGTLQIVPPPGWKVGPERVHVSLTTPGDSTLARFGVTIPATTPEGRYLVRYQVDQGTRTYALVVHPVRMAAPGLSAVMDGSNCALEEFVLAPSQVTVHMIGVEFASGLSYAYVEGASEELREALKPFGVAFHPITDAEMGHLALGGFDAIVIGPNAYLLREELRNNAPRFLEYVREGGTLIVQYQGYDYQDRGYTPYPFRYSVPHDRVTHEDAPVTVLRPDDLLLRRPNPIDARDFDHWVRDRGLYFWGHWDPRYEAPLACADPGEAPHGGGLVECRYGRGTYAYVGYSLFRQVPAGVPGAFRLLANLLALPVARLLERVEFLKTLPLFSALAEEHLDAVARSLEELVVEDGTWICRPGQAGPDTYIVHGGEVEVVTESDGRERVRLAKPGDCLGELGAMRGVLARASLRARGSVRLLVLRDTEFQSAVRQHPEIGLRVVRYLLSRTTDT